jgi:hypothetical protein
MAFVVFPRQTPYNNSNNGINNSITNYSLAIVIIIIITR